jgi:hypothetical protein
LAYKMETIDDNRRIGEDLTQSSVVDKPQIDEMPIFLLFSRCMLL